MKQFSNFLKLFSLVLLLAGPQMLRAQVPIITYESPITGFSSPVDLVNAGDGSNRLFIVEQGGTIRVRNGSTTTLFGNFGATGANIISAGGERGLLRTFSGGSSLREN